MIITAWNCNMKFHAKHAELLALNSDIMVISECAKPEVLLRKGLPMPRDLCVWAGKNPNKGLAVFARPPYRIERIYDDYEEPPIWCLPVRITTPSEEQIDLLAVWSQWYIMSGGRKVPIPNQVTAALSRFSSRMNTEDLIVAGDFNNNVIWSDPDNTRTHRHTGEMLASYGLSSAYHALSGLAHGEELAPTIFWQKRTIDGPQYHIDYIYLPNKWLLPPTSISIGGYANWVGSGLSDHVPITVTLPLIR
jgi:hypothetical protein